MRSLWLIPSPRRTTFRGRQSGSATPAVQAPPNAVQAQPSAATQAQPCPATQAPPSHTPAAESAARDGLGGAVILVVHTRPLSRPRSQGYVCVQSAGSAALDLLLRGDRVSVTLPPLR